GGGDMGGAGLLAMARVKGFPEVGKSREADSPSIARMPVLAFPVIRKRPGDDDRGITLQVGHHSSGTGVKTLASFLAARNSNVRMHCIRAGQDAVERHQLHQAIDAST